MLSEIETFAGKEVSIEVGQMPGPRGDFDNLLINHNEARIVLLSDDRPIQALVHEILHIKRMWLDSSPFVRADLSRIDSLPDDYAQALRDLDGNCGLIEDTLEHTFWILPAEKRLKVYDATHWQRVNAKILEESVQNRFPNRQREFGLRVWLDVHYLGDKPLIDGWRARLGEWGLMDAATEYQRAVEAAFPDKVAMLRVTQGHMQLPNEFLQIATMDVRRGRTVVDRLAP